ncbi:MAG: flagellar hook-length control protein FliK [Candidatus Weimeria sp.]
MKTEGIMSSVQNGQVVKKARNTKANAPNNYDFMSVMNTVSLSDISTGAGKSYDSSSDAVDNRTETADKSAASSAETKEVSVYSSVKNSSYSKVIDTAKTTTATKTDGQKTVQKDTAKTDASDKAADDNKTADKTTSEKTDDKTSSAEAVDDKDTKVEDKNTKAAGPETEDDKVERSEAANDLISDILNTISKDLGVSKDDITDAMDKLGLSFADLSIPSNTAELYTQLTGSDSGSLLTSDNFMSLLDDLQDIFSGVDDDLMSQLTPVTDEEAENLSDLVTGQQTDETASETEVTVVSVTTEETTVTVSTEAVSDTDAVQQTQTTDTSSDQTVNGTITNTAQQTASTDSETSDGSSDLTGNSGEQKSTADQVNVNALTAGNAQATGETEASDFISTIQKYTDINTDDLISQIVDKARQTLSSRVSSLEMELHPQSLGKIFLQVTEKSGDVTAHLYAQNEAVKHALENSLADLTENLNRQGIRVNEVTISVEPHAFDENLEKNMSNQFGNNPNSGTSSGTNEGDASSRENRSRSTIDLRNGALSDDLSSDEALEASIMQDNGNTVSYRI